jgi:hypothetical protein
MHRNFVSSNRLAAQLGTDTSKYKSDVFLAPSLSALNSSLFYQYFQPGFTIFTEAWAFCFMTDLITLNSSSKMSLLSASALLPGYQTPSNWHAIERHCAWSKIYDMQPLQGVPTHVNKPQIPSKKQWDELKPVVYRLYIKEDRRLKDVLREVRRKSHFLITYDASDDHLKFFSRLMFA